VSNVSLNIAVTGINASQTAMDVIAQNLSNANTPGYQTETVNLSTNMGGGILQPGDGVRVGGITQSSDGLLLSNAQQAAANSSQSSALQQVLQQAQLVFPSPTAGSGLAADLSTFWQSWDTIANNPNSSAGRLAVVNSAQNLTTDLQQANQQLTTTATNAGNQLNSVITSANGLLSQVASLNTQVEATGGNGGQASLLIDQRNQVMNQLSQAIGATGTLEADGSLKVNLGGVTLVQNASATSLAVSSSGGVVTLSANNSQTQVSPTAGTAAGLMAALNSYLPSYQSQLDGIASSLATTVNTQLAAGFTATGAAGTPLFTGTTAATIGVSSSIVSNPQLIAAASTSTLPDASNDGSNAQAMANLYNSPTGPDTLYQSLVLNVGSQVSAVNSQVTAQTAVSNAANQNLQSVVGVNTNDQMVQLLNFQQSYQAAAKVITTVDQAMQSLMAAV
jgi:flagellar hook-associated protein 1 FlgK